MDKNAIKKYAVWARRELISRVSQKAAFYGITDTDHGTLGAESVDGRVLTAAEKKQRDALIHQIQKDGYEQTIEEVAYTWFNRFSALRYMEVNGYLPTHVRVFTDDTGALKPQILNEAINLELDGLDMQKVYDLKNSNQDEALYRYLLITQCNALNAILPGMFQKIEDYTELLLPDNLLREGSVIEQMVTTIPEEDWTDQVQIIGWMYQYYNAEKKDEVFAALKKNIKITKENIPAATQLFTPDWIVRYMVENSLGRIFVSEQLAVGSGQGAVGSEQWPGGSGQGAVGSGQLAVGSEQWAEAEQERILKEKAIAEQMGWKYYLPEAEQTPEVRAKLNALTTDHLSLATLRVIDPCMGSGHILVYMFDVLVKIYEAYGYSARDAVQSIVENNLYGLDIDDRAAQLAYFAVMMKARQYDRRFFSRGLQPHVYAIAESNHLDKFALEYFCNGDEKLTVAMNTVIRELHDAKEYGSILNVTPLDWSALYARFAEIEEDISISREAALNELLPLVQVAEALAQKYDVVVTNPPYMGASGMCAKLSEFVKKNYPDSKSDLSTVCMERATNFCCENGYWTMINIPVWMFLSSYEKLRNKLFKLQTLTSMVHPGRGIFGSDFGTTTFVFQKRHIFKYKGHYRRLFDKQGEVESIEQREQRFFEKRGVFFASQDNFSKIPGSPVAYWVSEGLLQAFATGESLGNIALARNGMKTGENSRFVRLWWEVVSHKFNCSAESAESALSSGQKWFPYNKGGEFRKWYGNNDCIVNWENEGDEIFNHAKADKRNVQDYPLELKFRPSVSWSLVTSGYPAFRYKECNLSDIAGMSFFTQKSELLLLLGFCNSKIAFNILSILAPTINFQAGDIGRLPVVGYGDNTDTIRNLVSSNINESTIDWDSYEISWDFKRNPLV